MQSKKENEKKRAGEINREPYKEINRRRIREKKERERSEIDIYIYGKIL